MISKVVFEIKNSIRSWSDQEISFSSKNMRNVSIIIKDIKCELAVDGNSEDDNLQYIILIWELLVWEDGYFYKPKGAIIHHPEVGALRSPKAPRRRAVIFRSHGLLQIIQGTLRFPCAGCRQLPFCRFAIWGHLALQAVPSRQIS